MDDECEYDQECDYSEVINGECECYNRKSEEEEARCFCFTRGARGGILQKGSPIMTQ